MFGSAEQIGDSVTKITIGSDGGSGHQRMKGEGHRTG
jgi:hypothetical protein